MTTPFARPVFDPSAGIRGASAIRQKLNDFGGGEAVRAFDAMSDVVKKALGTQHVPFVLYNSATPTLYMNLGGEMIPLPMPLAGSPSISLGGSRYHARQIAEWTQGPEKYRTVGAFDRFVEKMNQRVLETDPIAKRVAALQRVVRAGREKVLVPSRPFAEGGARAFWEQFSAILSLDAGAGPAGQAWLRIQGLKGGAGARKRAAMGMYRMEGGRSVLYKEAGEVADAAEAMAQQLEGHGFFPSGIKHPFKNRVVMSRLAAISLGYNPFPALTKGIHHIREKALVDLQSVYAIEPGAARHVFGTPLVQGSHYRASMLAARGQAASVGRASSAGALDVTQNVLGFAIREGYQLAPEGTAQRGLEERVRRAFVGMGDSAAYSVSNRNRRILLASTAARQQTTFKLRHSDAGMVGFAPGLNRFAPQGPGLAHAGSWGGAITEAMLIEANRAELAARGITNPSVEQLRGLGTSLSRTGAGRRDFVLPEGHQIIGIQMNAGQSTITTELASPNLPTSGVPIAVGESRMMVERSLPGEFSVRGRKVDLLTAWGKRGARPEGFALHNALFTAQQIRNMSLPGVSGAVPESAAGLIENTFFESVRQQLGGTFAEQEGRRVVVMGAENTWVGGAKKHTYGIIEEAVGQTRAALMATGDAANAKIAASLNPEMFISTRVDELPDEVLRFVLESRQEGGDVGEMMRVARQMMEGHLANAPMFVRSGLDVPKAGRGAVKYRLEQVEALARSVGISGLELQYPDEFKHRLAGVGKGGKQYRTDMSRAYNLLREMGRSNTRTGREHYTALRDLTNFIQVGDDAVKQSGRRVISLDDARKMLKFSGRAKGRFKPEDLLGSGLFERLSNGEIAPTAESVWVELPAQTGGHGYAMKLTPGGTKSSTPGFYGERRYVQLLSGRAIGASAEQPLYATNRVGATRLQKLQYSALNLISKIAGGADEWEIADAFSEQAQAFEKAAMSKSGFMRRDYWTPTKGMQAKIGVMQGLGRDTVGVSVERLKMMGAADWQIEQALQGRLAGGVRTFPQTGPAHEAIMRVKAFTAEQLTEMGISDKAASVMVDPYYGYLASTQRDLDMDPIQLWLANSKKKQTALESMMRLQGLTEANTVSNLPRLMRAENSMMEDAFSVMTNKAAMSKLTGRVSEASGMVTRAQVGEMTGLLTAFHRTYDKLAMDISGGVGFGETGAAGGLAQDAFQQLSHYLGRDASQGMARGAYQEATQGGLAYIRDVGQAFIYSGLKKKDLPGGASTTLGESYVQALLEAGKSYKKDDYAAKVGSLSQAIQELIQYREAGPSTLNWTPAHYTQAAETMAELEALRASGARPRLAGVLTRELPEDMTTSLMRLFGRLSEEGPANVGIAGGMAENEAARAAQAIADQPGPATSSTARDIATGAKRLFGRLWGSRWGKASMIGLGAIAAAKTLFSGEEPAPPPPLMEGPQAPPVRERIAQLPGPSIPRTDRAYVQRPEQMRTNRRVSGRTNRRDYNYTGYAGLGTDQVVRVSDDSTPYGYRHQLEHEMDRQMRSDF